MLEIHPFISMSNKSNQICRHVHLTTATRAKYPVAFGGVFDSNTFREQEIRYMRELSVYYCSKCGFYGYYQLPQNAVCPHCRIKMIELPMTYQNFMRMECHARDKLIADQMAGDVVPYTSVVQRITEPEKNCNGRLTAARLKSQYESLTREFKQQSELIEQLQKEKEELLQKNRENESTIKWMHDMIWDLTRRLHSKDGK